MQEQFPELLKMIIDVGIEINQDYKWGESWFDEDESFENDDEEANNITYERDFKIEKLQNLKAEL